MDSVTEKCAIENFCVLPSPSRHYAANYIITILPLRVALFS